MQNFKLLIAIMFAVSMMDLHGSTESSMNSAMIRNRASSKEIIERLAKETAERASLPCVQLAAIIEIFQKNQIQPLMMHVRPASQPSIQARFKALSTFYTELKIYRSYLENRSCAIDVKELAQSVQNKLEAYKLHSGKIDVVVKSQHFLNIEKKCRDIIFS